MSTYILDGHDRITIARRPVTVTVSSGAPPGQVLLGSFCGAEPDRAAIHPRPGVMILPSITGETVVRVLPGPARDVFPEGTVVSVTLRTEPSRDADEDVVVVESVDVSSQFHRDLVVVDLDGGRLSVAALNAVPDPPLPQLPAAARGAARACLGADRLPDPVDVVIAVDTSASMVPALADGSVAAAVDVLAGLSHVIGWGRGLAVYLIGDHAERLPEVPAADLAAATVAVMEQFGFGCGCHSAPAGPTGTITFVVTDAVPADIATSGATRRSDPTRHIVLLGPPGTRLPGPGGPPVTVIPQPLPGSDAGAQLVAVPGLLTDVMGSLLAGVGPGDRHDNGRESA